MFRTCLALLKTSTVATTSRAARRPATSADTITLATTSSTSDSSFQSYTRKRAAPNFQARIFLGFVRSTARTMHPPWGVLAGERAEPN